MTRTDVITGTRSPLLGLLAVLSLTLASCRAPQGASFSFVQKGMTQKEVLELLGPPSSRWTAPVPKPGEPPLAWTHRWQYGDTLSTTASTAIGQDIAPDGVWVIKFNAADKVVDFRPPIEPDHSYPMERPPK